MHGYTEQDGLIILKNRPGEHILRMEDILKTIEEHGPSVAVIFLSGVHYYTGNYKWLVITTVMLHVGCIRFLNRAEV